MCIRSGKSSEKALGGTDAKKWRQRQREREAQEGCRNASLWPLSIRDTLAHQLPWASKPLLLKTLHSSHPPPHSYPCSSTLFICPHPSPSSQAIGLVSREPQSYIPASLAVTFWSQMFGQTFSTLAHSVCSRKKFCFVVRKNKNKKPLSPVVDPQASGLSYLILSFFRCNSRLTRTLDRMFW